MSILHRIRFIAQNFSKPKGIFGSYIIHRMNQGHASVIKWALGFDTFDSNCRVLDIGCGGGASTLLLAQTSKQVIGIDYSETSVAKAKQLNSELIAQNKVEIIQASVSEIPFEDSTFDYATAFETIYFWPDLVNDFKEVLRVLKPGGIFLIGNDMPATKEGAERVESSIPNITLYEPKDVQAYLEAAGFVQINLEEKIEDADRFYCFTASRPL